MLIGAVSFLVFLIVGVFVLILADMRSRGWSNWLTVLDNWQHTIGTVVGFLSAAAVLVLGTALQRQSEQEHADAAARNLGQSFAFEAERMAAPLELGRQLALAVDLTNKDLLVSRCNGLSHALREQLTAKTPVFDAGITHLVDIGPDDLSNFVRFHAFYADFRQSLENVGDAACNAAPAEQVGYLLGQIKIGLGYYSFFSSRYEIAQFTPDGLIDPNKPKATQ